MAHALDIVWLHRTIRTLPPARQPDAEVWLAEQLGGDTNPSKDTVRELINLLRDRFSIRLERLV
jgi:hypothetical protein